LANALIQLGVKKGDRVALLLPNSPQMVMAYYAALKAGAVVVSLNPLFNARTNWRIN
jgi:long-chain acyl-CoA synthetase